MEDLITLLPGVAVELDCGAPSEVMTQALRDAILRYQLASFLEPTGELDEETIEELESETPATP